MLRWIKILVIVWMMGLAAASAAKTRPSDDAQVRVFVMENAGLSERVLLEAEKGAGRIFRMARVGVSWVNCGPILVSPISSKMQCLESALPGDLILRIIPNARSYTPDVFGVSFLDQAGQGRYADVFFAPIEQMTALDRELSLDAVLGDVIVHELGHLLLGNHAHSAQGIMRAHWQADQLHGLSAGRLFFTKDQAAQLRVNVRTKRQRAVPLVVAEVNSVNRAQ